MNIMTMREQRARFLHEFSLSGEFPQLLSLEILHDAAKCKKRFGVPDCERVADEL